MPPRATIEPAPVAASAAPGAPPTIPQAQAPSTPAPPAGTAFSTRHARFTPAAWHELPGWSSEPAAEALQAFRRGCTALEKRKVWNDLCARARQADSRSTAPARAFFEREFELYRVQEADRSDTGVITGYFEPLLNGSRRRSGAFVHPVHGVPADLLYLDARKLRSAPGGGPRYARVAGREVVPVPSGGLSPADAARQGLYVLDLGGAAADVRDRRVRVRIDGWRIAPYLTRQQIERGDGLAAMHVIAWVDSPDALYLLQVQGSGKIRLPTGEIVRVGFAEQNGHAFSPKIIAAAGPGAKTRGVVAAGAASQATAGVSAKDAAVSPEVQRIIEAFLAQEGARRSEAPPVASSPRPGGGSPPAAARPAPPARDNPGRAPEAFYAGRVSSATDPSYVFFREIPDSALGPVGALGVPLTAGRSLAVDPRTTPLGAPVFISAQRPGAPASVNRLMVAQDTGGAIRGAVRADYFWGFGPAAGTQALQMKDELRMWVLLPYGLQVAAQQALLAKTRGLPGGQADSDCVVPDAEFCVE